MSRSQPPEETTPGAQERRGFTAMHSKGLSSGEGLRLRGLLIIQPAPQLPWVIKLTTLQRTKHRFPPEMTKDCHTTLNYHPRKICNTLVYLENLK